MADTGARVWPVGEQTSLSERKKRAGQRLILGFAGPEIDAEFRALVQEVRPAGFILFSRNVLDPVQVRELNRELAGLVETGRPTLLTVDQEGGRVQRVREPATCWPPMRAVGARADVTGRVSTGLAEELLAMGFNLNFAPVADVDSNPDNPVIGDRSFGRDPAEVARHVAAFVQAHQACGMVACAKHFPGHGDTALDSHLDLPVVHKTREALMACEWVPFRESIRAGVSSVMTAHVVFPALDETYPATLSAKITRDVLRGELGFDGVVFSDDLDMKAVADRWPLEEQIRRGTEASVDVFLSCKERERQHEAFRALVIDQEVAASHDNEAREAVERLDQLRLKIIAPRPPMGLDRVGCDAHQDLARSLKDGIQ